VIGMTTPGCLPDRMIDAFQHSTEVGSRLSLLAPCGVGRACGIITMEHGSLGNRPAHELRRG
jgi:hypothetical protein